MFGLQTEVSLVYLCYLNKHTWLLRLSLRFFLCLVAGERNRFLMRLVNPSLGIVFAALPLETRATGLLGRYVLVLLPGHVEINLRKWSAGLLLLLVATSPGLEKTNNSTVHLCAGTTSGV